MHTFKQLFKTCLHFLYYPLKYAGKPYFKIYCSFRRFTMVPPGVYIKNLRLAKRYYNIPGAVVECGTWKGGMIAGIAMLFSDQRQYYLFDSFQGLPAAGEKDGQALIDWQRNVTSPFYYDNCRAEESIAKEAMQRAKCNKFFIHKGWFKDTLIEFPAQESIALLRLDGDLYDSTMQCLEALYPRLTKGGVVIVDDYGIWDGCTKAVQEYIKAHCPDTIVHYFEGMVAYFEKT